MDEITRDVYKHELSFYYYLYYYLIITTTSSSSSSSSIPAVPGDIAVQTNCLLTNYKSRERFHFCS